MACPRCGRWDENGGGTRRDQALTVIRFADAVASNTSSRTRSSPAFKKPTHTCGHGSVPR
ncbi:MAG: hypothetical protein OJF55_001055 [Rhodanobacteraceae bacterium]|nr:MAG: hypothetical protein OJF55_001055 [Rhodanobacteraceae bacterium]